MADIRGSWGNDAIHVRGDGTEIPRGYYNIRCATDRADRIHANFGDDIVAAGDGNDIIDGGYGDDKLYGQGGDDWLIGGRGADHLSGGIGTDTADYSCSSGGVGVDLNAGIGKGGDAEGDTFQGVDNLRGSRFNDVLTGHDVYPEGSNLSNLLDGGAGDDTLNGRNGKDTLVGGDGNDTLIGGSDADALQGGSGTDMVRYDGSAGGVTVDLGAGTGTGGDAQGDTFDSVENLFGSALGDKLTGSDVANVIGGGSGDDVIDGAGGNDNLWGERGADMLRGGSGDDKLTGGAGGDVLDGGAGSDSAYYDKSSGGVTIDLGAHTAAGGEAQGDTLVSVENVYGSADYADKLTGDAGANYLVGLGGNDALIGGAGNDRLDGGLGNDKLEGGAGADALHGSLGADVFVYRSVADSAVDAAGRDTIDDFRTGDLIHLAVIDADGESGNGNTAFTFSTGGAFSGTGRELIAVSGNGVTTVYGDINGDRSADFAIDVHADHPLTAADFLL
ncbi:hypothetical protein KXS07_15215 [Inquilinus limosus]|uniref:calcium-binding protein n=1 Tax=Inquilinus limosus TaxID=171674 RepID=UPI003F148495